MCIGTAASAGPSLVINANDQVVTGPLSNSGDTDEVDGALMRDNSTHSIPS
jgi:hypothetical protein